MSLFRWIAGKALKLPPRRFARVEVVKDVPVAMRDGVILLADRYFPAGRPDAPPNAPVVLVRTPYGRGGLFGFSAALFAERGLQVVVQSVRGIGGSGGEFNPMHQEADDGEDTLHWVRAQPWFGGRLYTFGASYLGNVQWAMASRAPELIDGMALQVTLSNFAEELRGHGALTQAGMLGWTQLTSGMVDAGPGGKMVRPRPGELDKFHDHLPLGTIDTAAFGKPVPWWQQWIARDDPDDAWWQALDHRAAVVAARAPAAMTGGWQDIFLPFQIRDFEARQAAGLESWLTIGPWTHAAPAGMIQGLRDALALFGALEDGTEPFAGRGRVRLFVQGANQWRDYPSWPPPGAVARPLYLRSGGRLDPAPPEADEGAATYVYDPADPTPAVHGPRLFGGEKVRDMAALEARDDSIVFTGEPLAEDVEAIGPVTVALSVRSDRAHTDFYASLSDVDAKGRSIQVCDGYVRLRPGFPEADADGVRRVTIDCWPTAWRFRRGHRLRLVVASGAHPRFARNLGTGEPMATATGMVKAHQEVLHGSVLRVTMV